MNFASRSLVVLALCSCGGAPAAPPAPTPASAAAPLKSSATRAAAIRAGACGTGQTLQLGPPITYPPPPGASGALAIGYLNKDAPIDLLVGGADDRGVATIGVMLGTGDGTFKPPTAYPLLAGAQARSIALTDFDTDEDLDVVSAGGSGPPELFLNNGDGTFGAAVALPAVADEQSGQAVTVQVADIHGDAHPDVVTYAGGRFGVWHDQGHAAFVASTLPAIDGLEHGAGLALADFDRNGATDIAVAGTAHGAGVVVVLLGRRGGAFATAARLLAANGDATAVVAADFDGDGKLDLAASFVAASGGTIAVLRGKGDGTFGAPTSLPVAGAVAGAALIAADLDGDGRADLIATTRDGLAVFRANATGFDPAVALPDADLRQVAAGDLRGDHLLGLAATHDDGHATVWPAACL